MKVVVPNLLEMNLLRKNLNHLVRQRGLSLSAIAREAGVPKSNVHDWAQGVSPKNLSYVKKVADALGETVDRLCFEDLTKPSNSICEEQERASDVDGLLGDVVSGNWVSGIFELKIRRLKKK